MYQLGDTVPPRSYAYAYWQYSWQGKVSGIGGEVDLDIRILGNTTLKAPEISIPNTSITTEEGQDFNPMNGVSAKTSQGQNTTNNLSYAITNEAGQTVSLDQAKNTVGKYTITYIFKDPFRGTISVTAAWEVKARTVTDTPVLTPTTEPTESSGGSTDVPSPTPSSGNTDVPSPTPEGGSTDVPSTTPTEAPQATDTPVPTPTTAPSESTDNTENSTDG